MQVALAQRSSSYNQILKSTGIFGSSQIIVTILGFIRTKIVALLLGKTGVGLIGIYQSIIDTIRSFSSLGIDTGGIREVAYANSQEEKQTLTEMVSVIRWWFKLTALLGAAICVLFCYPISIWAFGSDSYALPVALLSICIFFTTLNLGQNIVIQGLRDIPRLVKANIISNAASLVISIPIYFIFELKGIAIAFIISAITTFGITLIYYRKLDLKPIRIPAKIALKKGEKMIKLGMFMVLAGVCNSLSLFLIKTYLGRESGLDEAGLFQAVWTITNVYLMLVLRSMGADFYPKLCSIINKRAATRKLVNEQTYIVLIIAVPIILGMILFSKPSLVILYSSDFIAATDLLQWQILGTFLKVLSWPMGFILLAKAKGVWHLFGEVSFYLIYLLSSYLFFPHFGLNALGIGYLLAYVAYIVIMFAMSGKLCGFKWHSDIWIMTLIGASLIIASFLAMHLLHDIEAYILCSIFFLISCVLSVIKLNKVVDLKKILKR